MSKLKININGTEYTDKYCVVNIPCTQLTMDATVFIDDSDILNHFKMTSNCDWITFRRVRNLVTILVSKNVSTYERMGYVLFEHNLDSNVFVRIMFVQEKASYTIVSNYKNIVFNTLLEQGTEDSETKIVTVNCSGGLCDFGVKPVMEFVRNNDEGTSDSTTFSSIEDILADNYKPYRNDMGIKIKKNGSNRIEITNFGKVSLFDKVYYVIILYHLNDPKSTTEIYITYDINNESGLELNDD